MIPQSAFLANAHGSYAAIALVLLWAHAGWDPAVDTEPMFVALTPAQLSEKSGRPLHLIRKDIGRLLTGGLIRPDAFDGCDGWWLQAQDGDADAARRILAGDY